jgi:hypothetical protein
LNHPNENGKNIESRNRLETEAPENSFDVKRIRSKAAVLIAERIDRYETFMHRIGRAATFREAAGPATVAKAFQIRKLNDRLQTPGLG